MNTKVKYGFMFVLALSGCALFQSKAVQAEGSYTGDLLACTASAKAHHPADTPADHAAGRAESEQCACEVNKRWGVHDADCT